MKANLLYALLFIMLSACTKKELPVKPHDPGTVTTATVNLGKPYTYQLYFCLKTRTIVGQNLKTAWDLGFEPSPEGYRVVLNTAKSMLAMNTGKSDFAAVSAIDTAGFSKNRRWDEPSGNLDSTAIGDWRTTNPVYIIDCGFNPAGIAQGLKKMQILSVTDSSYSVRFAALDGVGDTTITVKKDTAYNFAFVSFSTKAQVTIEPPKRTWDLAFSQYTYIFYDFDPPIPYLVIGCLLNRYGTAAAKDTTGAFAGISYTTAGSYTFSRDISTIGYDWKTFNGTSYVINTRFSYIIRTQDGLLYKLHFTGFYDKNGKEGNPQWEYQQL